MYSDILVTIFVYSGLIVLMTLWNRARLHGGKEHSLGNGDRHDAPLAVDAVEDPDEKEFFLGNRRIRTYLAFLSVIASETSVATVIVFPQIGYAGHLSLVWLPIGYIFGRFIVAKWILPDIYNYHRVSIYATVSQNDSANAFLSVFYLISKFLSSGVRIFLAGFALSTLLGISVTGWTMFMAVVTGFYCLSGGLRAVVWIDQIQGLIIYGAALVLLVILVNGDVSVPLASGAMEVSLTPLIFFQNLTNWEFTWGNVFYSPLLFLAGMVLTIGTHGTDQDILQRLLGTKTLASASRAMVLSGFGVLILIMAYTMIGYLLAQNTSLPLDATTPLLDFVNQSESSVWKILFSILVLAASTSTLAPAIHSMGAVWMAIRVKKNRLPVRQKRMGSYYSFFALIGVIVFAEISIELEKSAPHFLDLAMGVMNYVLGGKIAIFTYFAFLKKKLSLASIVIALLSGFTVTVICNYFLDTKPAWTLITLFATSAAFLCTGLNIWRETLANTQTND